MIFHSTRHQLESSLNSTTTQFHLLLWVLLFPILLQIASGRAVKIRLSVCTIQQPSRNSMLGVLSILLGSIIFNDNSSSRIGFKFYKYISKLIFATFWVLKKKKNFKVSFFFPVLSVTVSSGLRLPTTVRTPLSLQDALFLASQARSPRCRISHACVSARLLHIQ